MNKIQMAAMMYDARDSLKSLFPSKFEPRCKEWQEVIKKVADNKKLNHLEATIDIMQTLMDKAVAQMWVMAAYVEMVEPSGAEVSAI